MTVAAWVRFLKRARLREQWNAIIHDKQHKSSSSTFGALERIVGALEAGVLSGEEAARETLRGEDGAPELRVAPPREPAAHALLDLEHGGRVLLGAQLLQVGHLAGAEEDLRLAELVLVLALMGNMRHTSV